MTLLWRVSLMFMCVGAVACSYASQGLMAPDDRHAVVPADDVFGDKISRVVYLDQGWDATDSLWFYNTTQGSNLVPYDVFLHLEQAQSQTLFRDNANMNRYRYLPQAPHWDNPDGLPVGFVKDSFRGQDYVGFTCAACHTAQLNYEGEGIRIDGGPAMADMEGFLLGLEQALANALQNADVFDRLATAIAGADAKARDDVRSRVKAAYDRLRFERQQNQSAAGRYGYARVDAVGRIFNRVLSHATPGDATNFNPSNAPVSYPFLWDTPLHDFVQWNGLISNEKNQVGARNVGEVMGTFATFDLQTGQSSVVLRNLIRLERQLREKLYSPQWPSQFPKIDEALAAKGRLVFKRYRCDTCHADIGDRTSNDRRVIAQLASLDRIGTDRGQAHNAAYAQGRAGLFEGKRYARGGGRHQAVTPVNKALGSAIKKVMTTPDYDHSFVRRWLNLAYDLAVGLFDTTIKNPSRHVDHVSVGAEEKAEYLAVYKARPLNGVWATAPYLHNGSVPNLYEMFLPSCNHPPATEGLCRSTTFTVGSRAFDPVKVGFVSRDSASFPDLYVFDTRLPGNSNAGHEYSTGRTPVLKLDDYGHPVKDAEGHVVQEYLPPITDADRWALVEYLKAL
ncbi:MAG: di-heme-cytochrome C peroxidase [Deltaproteobacteria bacterium]|nr:di-heme-cytochrome C peroxidase [Deltaproteobacteria bacterium]